MLRGALDDARGGRGRLMLVTGEAGVGKTRLAEEIGLEGLRQKARVAWGRCHEGEGVSAFFPWVQILRALMRDLEVAQLRRLASAAGAILGNVAPAIGERLPDLPTPPPIESAADRVRLFDSVARFLEGLAKDAPLVVILDDLHEADRSSLSLLQFLVHDLRQMRVLVVATYRDVSVTGDDPLGETLAQVMREPGSDRLALRSFNDAEVAELISAHSGGTATAEIAAAVHRQTDGSPLFVVEFVRVLLAEGRLGAAADVVVPREVRAVIRRRLAPLSAPCREALEIVATSRRAISIEVLGAALAGQSLREGEDPRALAARSVREAVAAGILTEAPAAPRCYQFAHIIIRNTLYDEIAAGQRAELHRRVAEALERCAASDDVAVELAHHFFEATATAPADSALIDRAVRYARGAAEQAVSMRAYDEGASLYRLALAALDRREKPDQHQRASLWLALGEARRCSGAVPAARAAFTEATRLARVLGDPEVLGRAAIGCAGRYVEVGTVDEPLCELLEEALVQLPATDSALRARIMARLAAGLAYSQNRTRAVQLCELALPMAQRLRDPAALVDAFLASQLTGGTLDDPHRRLALATEIVRRTEAAGDLESAVEMIGWRIGYLLALGEMQAIDAEIARHTELTATLREPAYSWLSGMFRAMRALHDGRFAAAEELAGEAMMEGQRAHNPNAQQAWAGQLFFIRLHQGRLAELRLPFEAMAAQYSDMPTWSIALACVYIESDHLAEAGAVLERLAENEFAVLPRDGTWLMSIALLAEVAAVLGDTARAATLYALLLPFAERNVALTGGSVSVGPVARYLGLSAMAMGRTDDAERHLGAALALSTRLGARPIVAHVQQELATVLLRRGGTRDRQRAAELAAEALATARELGMATLAERAAALPHVALCGDDAPSLDAQPAGGVTRAAGNGRASQNELARQGSSTSRAAVDPSSAPRGASPLTILFTDLVDSTALLQRVGDERARHVLYTHRQVLREALASHAGREVKWLGDGVLATFGSVADAVRCAVTLAQRSRRPVAGERLGLRIGLDVGEVLPDENDYVGTPVVLARRLCDRAAAGQILCSGVVVELLRGRHGFEFAPVGPLPLKGFPEPVAAHEVRYQRDAGAAMLRHTPFAGRTAELRRLRRRLDAACAGNGGVVLLAGEPGIGKTRTLAELVETARAQGALVLWGRCYEGEATRPFGPFAEALGEYARATAPEGLRADLGQHGAALTRLVPELRARLPDLPEPVALEPHEERVRLLDAVTQSLLAVAARVPTVLMLDDLHWADPGTVTLLRHVARFASRARLLVLGAYRDVDVAAQHPLAEALGTLPRETSYEQLGLGGLDTAAVKELVDTVADREMPADWVRALAEETSGNPFFLREVLLDLEEAGALRQRDGKAPPNVASLRLPETVRQVMMQRLARLAPATNALLQVAAAFTGGIDFDVARRVAGLEERAALDALEAALSAQLLVAAAGHAAAYDFTHALVRHTLYEELSAARQMRLHRDIAETMEAVYGERASEHAAAIARHYHRSVVLPGAERGVRHAIAAADRAEREAAWDEVATSLRMALELMTPTDPARPRTLARMGLALAWACSFDKAAETIREAATCIAAAECHGAAAQYVAEAVIPMWEGAAINASMALAQQGLSYVRPTQRDATWASLMAIDILRQESQQTTIPGTWLDSPERREVSRIFHALCSENAPVDDVVPDHAKASLSFSSHDDLERLGWFRELGQYRRGLTVLGKKAADYELRGRFGQAASMWALMFRVHTALGEFDLAKRARSRSAALVKRLPKPPWGAVHLIAGEDESRMARDEGWGAPMEMLQLAPAPDAPPSGWVRVIGRSADARALARLGKVDHAIRRLATLLPAIDSAPAWAGSYIRVVCDAAETLWLCRKTDGIDVIDRNLRAKVIEPDLHYTMADGRLALARICSLRGQYDEALAWFAKARTVLDDQGARPLRAIVDYDEALMYVRRGDAADRERTVALLEAALAQFRAIGMPGWIRRAEHLLATGKEWSPGLAATKAYTSP